MKKQKKPPVTKQERYALNMDNKGYKRLRKWVHAEDWEDVNNYIDKKNEKRKKINDEN